MPRFKAALSAPFRAAGRLVMRWGRGRAWSWSALGASNRDWSRTVLDGGRNNAIVQACLNWVVTAFPEAPMVVYRRAPDGKQEPWPDHPLLGLLETPNPYYSGEHLWAATLADRLVSGNAYWLKVRAHAGQPVQLWWVPSTLIEPKWPDDDDTVFISHYEYRVDGRTPTVLAPADVVHFRYGFDPNNVRKGRSPLAALLREIASDDEAANWTASLLANMGVPGLIISPEADVELGETDAEEIKQKYLQRFGGDQRGAPLVLSAAAKVSILSFSPEQMHLTALRRIPEERISGALGIPAIVAGLGAGLDRSCVPADARVQTPTGTKTIAELVAGAVVWSFKDGQVVPRKVEHKWPARRAMVYEVRTKNRTLRATGNHPLMVRVPGSSRGPNHARQPSYEWRTIDALKRGDHVIFAKAYPDQGGQTLPDGREATPGMLQFLGAIVGDGTVTPGVDVRIAMPPTDRCVAPYRALAQSLFTKYQSGGERPWKRAIDGKTATIVAAMAAGQSYHAIGRDLGMHSATVRDRYMTVTEPKPIVTAPIVIGDRPRSFGFSSAQASQYLATLGVAGRAHTKRVPTWVYGLNRELRLAFLAGIVDTDGYIDARGALTMTFCNRPLVEDVRDLMIGLGIRCSNIGHRVMSPDVLPNPGTKDEYHAWTFTASSAVQVAEIPFADPLYRERVNANPTRERSEGHDAHKAGLSPDLGFVYVQRITPLGEMDVYDLTVEDGHSFFCENVLVSNTYANFQQAREAAWESHLLPTQRLLAAELRTQLVPDFGDPATLRIGFDVSQVRALMTDQDALHKRVRDDLVGGVLTRNQALLELGMPAEDGSDVLYIPTRVTPMAVTDLLSLRMMPARVTVPDVGAVLPEPGVDPQHPSEPAAGVVAVPVAAGGARRNGTAHGGA